MLLISDILRLKMATVDMNCETLIDKNEINIYTKTHIYIYIYMKAYLHSES